ncbi:GNAT family N-acetyltransferase [Jeotgalibacillus sp. JSM ZJ347]|uniref:GNAT family N-acetyltransferase n=1 Tax=Jeotgalibacillus sp. JSM ZJ347 TaxID=3342117 RepID=UPI0035A922EB
MKVHDTTIKLRHLLLEDVESALEWSRDAVFCQANSWQSNRDTDDVRRWWANSVNHPPEGFIRLGIVRDEILIGYADLASINGNTAELGLAIGKSGLWGKGIGAQAAVLMMNYGAGELGLTTFYAETHEANIRSRRMLEKLGFQEVSRVGYEEYKDKNNRLIQFHCTYE